MLQSVNMTFSSSSVVSVSNMQGIRPTT